MRVKKKKKFFPSNRIRTSDMLISVYLYSQPLYQLSYRRIHRNYYASKDIIVTY